MDRGFIKSWRKEFDSRIWAMPPIYHRVWHWILGHVQYSIYEASTPTKYVIYVLPGQKLTSLRHICEGVKWQEWGRDVIPNSKTIKSVLEWLEGNSMITVESNSKGTLVSVINWDTYNNSASDKVTDMEQAKVTDREQTLDTNKKEKKEEETKNICGEQSSPPVAPKKKTKKPSSPESVKLIYVEEYWKWVYSSCEERDYIFSYARDRKLLKGVLSAAGNMAWKVCSLMGAYISDPKRWPTNQPPTIPAFVNAVSRYTEDQCPDDYLPPDGEEWGDWQPWREQDGHS